MMKCPECGKDISSHAKVCNNCGFSFEYKIKLRVKIYLLDLYDVFNLHIVALCDGDEYAVASQGFLCDNAVAVPKTDNMYKSYSYVLTLETIFYGEYIDELQFIFEEHLREMVYKLRIGEYEEAHIGLVLTATILPDDVPSIVGGGYAYPGAFPQEVLDRMTTYNHPEFNCKFANYYEIEPKCILTAKYK